MFKVEPLLHLVLDVFYFIIANTGVIPKCVRISSLEYLHFVRFYWKSRTCICSVHLVALLGICGSAPESCFIVLCMQTIGYFIVVSLCLEKFVNCASIVFIVPYQALSLLHPTLHYTTYPQLYTLSNLSYFPTILFILNHAQRASFLILNTFILRRSFRPKPTRTDLITCI